MKNDDGGPAFPFTPNAQQQLSDGTWDQSYDPGESGMSRRQWLAGLAMQGIIANPAYFDRTDITQENVAKWAFQQADKMIAYEKQETEDAG